MLPDHQLATPTPWLEYVDTFVLVFTIIQEDSSSSTILIPIVLSFFLVYFFVPKSKLSTILYVAGMLQFHLTLSLNGLEAPDVDWCYWSPGCLLGRQWRSSSLDFWLCRDSNHIWSCHLHYYYYCPFNTTLFTTICLASSEITSTSWSTKMLSTTWCLQRVNSVPLASHTLTSIIHHVRCISWIKDPC